MWSLNVTIPQKVSRLIEEMAPALWNWEEICEDPTLVIKRFETKTAKEETEIRLLLEKIEPFDVQIGNIRTFDIAQRGISPVLYIEVESPGIEALHEMLVGIFGCVKGIEGQDYTPHITLARGECREYIEFEERPDPIQWEADELEFWHSGKMQKRNKIKLKK